MIITKQEADKIISSGTLKRVKSKTDFPKPWYDSMNLSDMSDINGSFNSSDATSGPHKRMLAGAFSEQFGLMIYEQGGFAFFQQLLIYQQKPKGINHVYTEGVDEKRIEEIETKLGK